MNNYRMKHPLISIITVNYKQPTVTCELLDSINNLTYPNLETIVVDNAQAYDDTMLYKSHLYNVRVINAKENLGFAGGNNLGIKAANGEYTLLLNNDTVITDGVIETLLSTFQSDSQVGAVSPIIKYFDAPDKIQFAGFTEISKLTGRNNLIRIQPQAPFVETPYFHGAAVMICRRAIEKSGLMPEEYFLYYEELDWSRRIRRSGYKIKVATTVHILHKESISTGKNSPLKVYYQNRNRIHFMRQGGQSLFFLLFFLVISVPKNVLSFSLHAEWKHLSAFWSGLKHAIVQPKFGQQAF